MMEAVSGSVTAAGIHLKVAAGMDKKARDGRKRGEHMEKELAMYDSEILAGCRARQQFRVWE